MKKILIFFIFIVYQTCLQSKESPLQEFNQKYLSNYFSALLYSNNMNDEKALKHFNSSKYLLSKHDNFLPNYVFNLVENNKINKAIITLENYKKKKIVDNFQLNVLSIINYIKNEEYVKAKIELNNLNSLNNNTGFDIIIAKTLKSYVDLFLNKKIDKNQEDFGKLSLVTMAFQECYLDQKKSDLYFLNLLDENEGDYSRYLYFYITNLINKKKFNELQNISANIDLLNTNLLVSQTKKWIDDEQYYNFTDFFSCQNENHLISEFLFLIANLYSSQEEFKLSNFYLYISQFLNEKFYFNNSLLSENYILSNNYVKAKQTLKKLNRKEDVYKWYNIKKTAQILTIENDEDYAINYIEKKLKNIRLFDIKILFDLGNIYKNFKDYETSIKYYNKVLELLDRKSFAYSETLYRRGSSYERLNNFAKSDEDLINSLKIIPDDPFVMNYLAYSWLERNYKIDLAMEMLIKAYNQEQDNPYIIDSLGWAYFLTENFVLSEKYLKQAVELKPYDPVISDHYGDVLWMLGRKLQAKYFWNKVLKMEYSDDLDLDEIKNKIILGIRKL